MAGCNYAEPHSRQGAGFSIGNRNAGMNRWKVKFLDLEAKKAAQVKTQVKTQEPTKKTESKTSLD